LLLPMTQPMIYTKKFSKKVPDCPNLNVGADQGCFKGSRKDLEKKCNEHSKCQGFSFTHFGAKKSKKASNKGRGCLKYRCEQVTDDGKHFQKGDKLDFWTKQAFLYKTTPPMVPCTVTCGFGGDVKKGRVFCTQIINGKEVSDDMCDYWIPKLTRPKLPTKTCPPTKPCTHWKIIQAPQCRALKCGAPAYTQRAQPQCTQNNNKAHVADSACAHWKQAKPSELTRHCVAAAACTNYVAETPPGCWGVACGQPGFVTTGGVNCKYTASNTNAPDSLCQYWGQTRPAARQRGCAGGGRCCGQKGKCQGDCCSFVSLFFAPTNSCTNCPFGNHHVWPNSCSTSRRCS